MTPLIQVSNIIKKYGDKVIYDHANIQINKGESIALLGHNGSGKSTFLRIVCGLTAIDSGEIKFEKKIRFNYIPEHFPQLNITARKYINHIGNIDGLKKQEYIHKSIELFKKFYMDDMIDIPLKHLSKGTLQKVGVIQALLIKPDVLLLDEPLSGQDIDSQKVFITLMNELNEQGTTLIMSCHEKFLVNRISNTVYEISEGKFQKIRMEYIKEESNILVFERDDDKKVDEDIFNLIEKIEYKERIIIILVTNENSNEVIKKLINTGFRLRSMTNEGN